MDPIIKENVCRLCANHGENYHSIFDSNSPSIFDKITNCLPIEITRDDELPSHVCSACLEALNVSDKLRAQSLVADEILRQQLRIVLIDEIKQEKDVDPDEISSQEDVIQDEESAEYLEEELLDEIKQEKDDTSDDESQEVDQVDHQDQNDQEETTEPLFCGICEVYFEEFTDFDRHMRSSHSTEFVCDICQEDCKTSEDLLRHKYKEHYEIIIPPDNSSSEDSSNRVNESIEIKEEDLPTNSEFAGVLHQSTAPRNIICDVCNVTITTEKLMALHLKMHEPRSITCPTCFRVFPSPYDLFTHKQTVHKVFVNQKMKWYCEKCERFTSSIQFLKRHTFCQKIKLNCKYCSMSFFKRSELQIHQKKNHYEDVMKDPESEKFECKDCGKSYVDEAYYNSHVRKHQAKKEGLFTCPTCEKKFSTAAVLKCHIEVIHEKQRKYVCDICSKSFCGSRNLQVHRKRHASQTCQECGEKFENTRILATHLFKKHNISVPSRGKYSCKLCGKKFLKLRLLKDHRNTHTGTRPHSCETCHKTFRTYAARWAHEQRHKNGGFICDYCKHNFTDKNNLRRHMSRHLPPEDWRYECEICNRKLQRLSHLQRHLERHTETHPYRCNICGFRFLSKGAMTAHKNLTHNEILTNRAPQTVFFN